jgi:hypothetical protein
LLLSNFGKLGVLKDNMSVYRMHGMGVDSSLDIRYKHNNYLENREKILKSRNWTKVELIKVLMYCSLRIVLYLHTITKRNSPVKIQVKLFYLVLKELL